MFFLFFGFIFFLEGTADEGHEDGLRTSPYQSRLHSDPGKQLMTHSQKDFNFVEKDFNFVKKSSEHKKKIYSMHKVNSIGLGWYLKSIKLVPRQSRNVKLWEVPLDSRTL